MEKSIEYFENSGKENTEKLIEIVKRRIANSDIRYIVIASLSGETALKVADALGNMMHIDIISVTSQAHFKEKNSRELSEYRAKMRYEGITPFVASHALSSVGKRIHNLDDATTPVEIIAETLGMFSQGIKVCGKISIMLAEAGLIPINEKILAIGGRKEGADSAAIITSAQMINIFDMRIHEIIAMPLK
jgi:hypothetical protein